MCESAFPYTTCQIPRPTPLLSQEGCRARRFTRARRGGSRAKRFGCEPPRLRRLFLEGFFRSFGGELQFTSIEIVIDDDRLSIPDFALQDEPAERSFDFLLDRALQRTRAIVGIVSDAHEMSLGRVRKFNPNVAFIEAPAQVLELDVDNLLQMFFRKCMEHDDLIHAIEKFR